MKFVSSSGPAMTMNGCDRKSVGCMYFHGLVQYVDSPPNSGEKQILFPYRSRRRCTVPGGTVDLMRICTEGRSCSHHHSIAERSASGKPIFALMSSRIGVGRQSTAR